MAYTTIRCMSLLGLSHLTKARLVRTMRRSISGRGGSAGSYGSPSNVNKRNGEEGKTDLAWDYDPLGDPISYSTRMHRTLGQRTLGACPARLGHAGSPLGSRRLSYADDHGDSSTDKGVGGSPMKKKDCVIADRQPKAFRPRIVAHNSVVAPAPIIHRSTTTDSSPPTTEVRNNPSSSSVVYRGETTGLLVQADTAESYC